MSQDDLFFGIRNGDVCPSKSNEDGTNTNENDSDEYMEDPDPTYPEGCDPTNNDKDKCDKPIDSNGLPLVMPLTCPTFNPDSEGDISDIESELSEPPTPEDICVDDPTGESDDPPSDLEPDEYEPDTDVEEEPSDLPEKEPPKEEGPTTALEQPPESDTEDEDPVLDPDEFQPEDPDDDDPDQDPRERPAADPDDERPAQRPRICEDCPEGEVVFCIPIPEGGVTPHRCPPPGGCGNGLYPVCLPPDDETPIIESPGTPLLSDPETEDEPMPDDDENPTNQMGDPVSPSKPVEPETPIEEDPDPPVPDSPDILIGADLPDGHPDKDLDGDGIINMNDSDDDGDGVKDDDDFQPTHLDDDHPMKDLDGDLLHNKIDDDDDGDGVPDVSDPEPYKVPDDHPRGDFDGDNIRNDIDNDDDNDGIPDTEDPSPFVPGTLPVERPDDWCRYQPPDSRVRYEGLPRREQELFWMYVQDVLQTDINSLEAYTALSDSAKDSFWFNFKFLDKKPDPNLPDDPNKQVLYYINKFREANGVHPVCWNDDLAAMANFAAENMANDGRASHDYDHGGGHGQNYFTNSNVKHVANVAEFGRGGPFDLYRMWTESPSHNAYLLSPTVHDGAVVMVDGFASYHMGWELGGRFGARTYTSPLGCTGVTTGPFEEIGPNAPEDYVPYPCV